MQIRTSARVGRLGACILLTGGILFFVLQPSSSVGQAAAAKAGDLPGYSDDFAKLGFKFDGAASCSNANCHGADEPQEGKGATTLAEFTQWSGGDLHAKAFETLTNEHSAEIAGKLKIKDATASARCTSCHALDVPEKLHGKDYTKDEGVTCTSCHGPSEKWIGPHKEKGWTDKEREATKTNEALLKKWGLYDTKGPLARANMCTSCHLAIDADMVAAGHPVPSFELDYYSKGEDKGGYYVSQHWRDPKVPFYNVSLWSTGQVVALRDAMTQLAERASAKAPDEAAVTGAYKQAMAHYSVFKPAAGATAKAWDAPAAALADAVKGKKMADVAKNATAIAAEADKLAPSIGAMKYDKAKTLEIIKAVLADTDASKMYGEQAMLQQAYAAYSLYAAYNPSDSATIELIVNSLFPPEDGKPDAAKFAQGLKAVSAKVK